jgi:hypothetical protein
MLGVLIYSDAWGVLTSAGTGLKLEGWPGRLKFLALFCDPIGSLQYKLNAIFRTSDMPICLFFEWLAATARLNTTKSASLYVIRQQLSSSTELSFPSNA